MAQKKRERFAIYLRKNAEDKQRWTRAGSQALPGIERLLREKPTDQEDERKEKTDVNQDGEDVVENP